MTSDNSLHFKSGHNMGKKTKRHAERTVQEEAGNHCDIQAQKLGMLVALDQREGESGTSCYLSYICVPT